MRNVKWLILVASFTIVSCRRDKIAPRQYKTDYVVIVVMDGARYSETYGMPSKQYIPRMSQDLGSIGCWSTSFYNTGITNTTNGHVAMTTGFLENNLDNSGFELPTHPSIFQEWMKLHPQSQEKAWIVASKDKLEVLGNTKDNSWRDTYLPSTDCGINGLGSGYRSDSLTFAHSIKILNKHQPKLLLINFKDPDTYGHAGDWQNYLQSIQTTDEYIYSLWQTIEQNPEMSGKTTLIVTNDHGRHTSSFNHHGDDCEGCRKIFFFACGPDFKSNVELNTPRSLIDIHATVSELLGIQNFRRGSVMVELFK